MKKIFVLAIIGILTISMIGCDSKSQNNEINGKDINVSNDINNTENESSDRLVDKKIALEDAVNINIDIKAAEVNISVYDGEDVKITGKLSKKSTGVDLNKDGNKIKIVEERQFSIGSGNDGGSKFDILIPSKLNGNFVFSQSVGTCDINGIKVNKIDITGGAGKLKCEDIKFDKLNLNSGVGETDLDLKEKCGDIAIAGGVGKINIKMAEVGGNMSYKGGVGECNITIPQNSPVKFVKRSGLGKCEINAKTSGEDTYAFDLKVGVGSIKIHN